MARDGPVQVFAARWRQVELSGCESQSDCQASRTGMLPERLAVAASRARRFQRLLEALAAFCALACSQRWVHLRSYSIEPKCSIRKSAKARTFDEMYLRFW